MSRKCKFDPEWKKALSCMHPNDARRVREIIINYQETGIMPSTIETKFEIILLLVQPIIDRRRRAAARAKIRRQQQKMQQISVQKPQQTTTTPTVETPQEQHTDAPEQPMSETSERKQPPLAIQVQKHRQKQHSRRQRMRNKALNLSAYNRIIIGQ